MAAADGHREEQLAYSEQMAAMLDERKRRQKAQKILAVVRHALGRTDLEGLRALDVGCSAGFIADELALAGARTTGVDIDEPGLAKARERFGDRVDFRHARGEALPFDDASVLLGQLDAFPDASMDVIVFNHIYEHVVDPEAVVADIHRVLAPGGVLYLGIGHKHQLVEPHHKLPLLSWRPQRAADRYQRRTRRGAPYYAPSYARAGRGCAAGSHLHLGGVQGGGARRPAAARAAGPPLSQAAPGSWVSLAGCLSMKSMIAAPDRSPQSWR